MAADKLLARDNMKSAIRNPNLKDLAVWPLPVDKTAIAATDLVLGLDKTAVVDKTAIAACRPSALIKRPLRLAGLDKAAIRFAVKHLIGNNMKSAIRSHLAILQLLVDKTATAWPSTLIKPPLFLKRPLLAGLDKTQTRLIKRQFVLHKTAIEAGRPCCVGKPNGQIANLI